MNDGLDMGAFVAPKSAQLTAEDLLTGPRTLRRTRGGGTGNGVLPVAGVFSGDDNKRCLTCKTVRRLLVAAWGREAAQYAGRSMTIYRDPKVVFGGLEVGGIRVSHMSHIEKRLDLALMATKGKRASYCVEPLKQEGPDIEAGVRALIDQIGEAASVPALEALTASDAVTKRRTWLAKNRADLAQQVDAAVAKRLAKLNADDFPGVVTPREEVA